MSRPVCSRERDVLRAVARGWRDDADAAAAAHVAGCERCHEVRQAAELLRAAHQRDTDIARVPSGAAMWWRLERRLRVERARRVQRIAMAMQAVVLASAVGVAAAVLQIAAPLLRGPGTAAAQTWSDGVAVLTAWSHAAAAWMLPVAMLVAAWLVLVPAALYLGLAEE